MSSSNNVVVVQMDFAQNFALLAQHEIQSAHFDKPQVTVFTAFVVMGSEHKNFVMISDYLEHVRTSLHFYSTFRKKNICIGHEICIFCSTVLGFYYKADSTQRSSNQLRY